MGSRGGGEVGARVVLVFGFLVFTAVIVFTATTALTCSLRRAIVAPSAGAAAATVAPADSIPSAATIEPIVLIFFPPRSVLDDPRIS